jgi:hypothetical protein
MRRHETASQILLILSIFNFVLAAPVAVREINEVRANAVDTAKVRMAVSEKRMDPVDQSSTNAGYLTDESVVTWNTISSDSTASSESDTATSRQSLSTGSHPGQAGNPSPSHSVSTDDPPQSPQPAPDLPPPSSPEPSTDNSPPSSPQPAPDSSHPPPSNPGPFNRAAPADGRPFSAEHGATASRGSRVREFP